MFKKVLGFFILIFLGCLTKIAHAEPITLAGMTIAPWMLATLGAGAVAGTGAATNWFGLGGDDEMSQWDMWEREFEERKKPATFLRAPEYEEAVGARGKWWEELQGGYLPEDWGDIWEQAKKKYSQYYWGGPGGQPGVAAKVKASAARRGVSESPALETMMGRMGMEEAGGLRDIDISEITGRMGERQNWLNQIRALSSMQVPGTWDKYGGMAVAQPTPSTPWSDLATAGGEYLGQMGAQTQQQNWYEKMFDKFRMPGQAQSGITYGGGYGGATQGFEDMFQSAYQPSF